MDRVTKKIKHGAVLVEFEESVVVVHYDIETVGNSNHSGAFSPSYPSYRCFVYFGFNML